MIADRAREMAAFDALPRVLRDLINDAPLCQSAVMVEQLVRSQGVDEVVADMRLGRYVLGALPGRK